MGKFSIGDKIPHTTLSVLNYVSESRVRCKCSDCGQGVLDNYVSMVYNEADLLSGKASCRFCAEQKKAIIDGVYAHRDTFMKMIAKNSPTDIMVMAKGSRCLITDESDLEDRDKDIAIKFPLGENVNLYGDLVAIAYLTTIRSKNEYGICYTRPTMIALKCRNCGYIKFIEFKDIVKVKHVCPLCYRLKSQMKFTEQKREEQQLLKDAEKSQLEDFSSVKTEFSKFSTNKLMQKNVKALENKNKGYKVVDITKDGGATTYHLVCEKCGSIVTCMRSNARLSDCSFCNSREQNKDYTKQGYLFRDYVGSIFNSLRVISQTGLTCEVECIRCKKKRVGVSIYDVISRHIFCDCERSKVSVLCPKCGYDIYQSYKNIYSGNFSCSCPKCNTSIDKEEFLISSSSLDYANSLRSKLSMANESISDKGATNKIRFGNEFAVEHLVVESEPVYKGNDEKSYYRCFCKIHNLGLTLSGDEIRNYEHQYCDDSRQKIIANPDADSISMS